MTRYTDPGPARNGVDVWPSPEESDSPDFGPSLTRQSDALGTDINIIMAQYERTGTLPVNVAEQLFDDVSECFDFRDSLERVRDADTLFMSLPARVRARFDNDAVRFLEYFQEPGHDQELVDLGLREAPPPRGEPSKAA